MYYFGIKKAEIVLFGFLLHKTILRTSLGSVCGQDDHHL